MVDRLVLGTSSLGHVVIEELVDRAGGVHVVTDDENRLETLMSDGVPVTAGDPTDPTVLGEFDSPGLVVVAGTDADRNVATAQTAQQVFGDAVVIAYSGRNARDHATKLDTIADRVIDPGRETARFLLDRVGDGAVRLRQLQGALRDVENLAVVTHDNPDPDAIASAVALSRLAARVGCEAEVCYYGDITHQENRAFVNLLGFELRNLGPDSDLGAFDGFALVDHSRPGVNDQLPEDLPIDIVIDHHPPRTPVEAKFVDLRSDVGATSTLLVDYLDHLGVTFSEELATGLLFGIRVDTAEFTRETAHADFEAAATLLPHAELGTLERIESPSVSPATFDTIADAIINRERDGQVVTSGVGHLSDRDALAQAADRLLALEGVMTTVVYGVREGTIYISARSRGTEMDLGEILRDAFDQIGSAGGHADMAGAQITLGVLESVDDMEESLLEVVGSVVTDRFFDALQAHSTQTVTGVYADDHGTDQYLVPPEERPVLGREDETPERLGGDERPQNSDRGDEDDTRR